ncbi:hypothetical protein [Anoxybacillus flavithermus]|nr:hypothetical protein [Anoxybacillus flavithermus]
MKQEDLKMIQELIKYENHVLLKGNTLHSLSIESATNEKYLLTNNDIFY